MNEKQKAAVRKRIDQVQFQRDRLSEALDEERNAVARLVNRLDEYDAELVALKIGLASE